MPNKVYSDSFNRLNVHVRRNEKSSLGNVVFVEYTVEQINSYSRRVYTVRGITVKHGFRLEFS